MKSDYYRYLAEFATGETKSKAGEDACYACVEANKIAENDLAVTHPVRLAMDTKFLRSLKTRCSETNEKFDRRAANRQAELKAVIDAIGILNSDTSFDTYDKTVCTDFLQMSPLAGEQALRQCALSVLRDAMNKVVDGPVVQVEHVPQSQVAEETAEIAQLDVFEKNAETPQTQTIQGTQAPESLGTTPVCQVAQTGHVEVVEIETSLPTESASAMFVSTPVPQAVEELVEASKAFSQNRVQQSSMEQIIANTAISLAAKTVEMPVTRTKEKTQHVANTHVQHAVNTVEAEKPIIIETINQVTKHVEIPQLQIVDVPGSQTQKETVPQDRMSDHVVQQTVKELRSKFEVGHMSEVHARNRSDKNRWRDKQRFEAKQYPQDAQERADLTNQRHVLAIRTVQKTVEVPRVQYIDKVADIPVDVQRQGSTIPDTDDLCLDETADEDQLEQENKKRKLPTPAEAVSESRANESDFDRFDDLVLPSPEGKTLFMNIASDDEARDRPEKEQEMTLSLVQEGESMLMDETDARSTGREMVQVIHAEWSQELREVRGKFADDVASEMTDVKNDLAHVREPLGVLVRRERCAETKTEIAARRLDRMEREQTEANDAEHEANLQEALANQSKAVKVVVDKWFVDKGYGFGKAPKGEIVFIHASAVHGAEVLTIGSDAWVQVVNDDARAQGGVPSKESLGPKRVEN